LDISTYSLFDGTGTGATGTAAVNAGAITGITMTNSGLGYEVGDSLSASNTYLGGSGAGFSITVATITAAAARVTLDVYSTEQVDALIDNVNSNALAYAVSLG
jgi:hypothetical protein